MRITRDWPFTGYFPLPTVPAMPETGPFVWHELRVPDLAEAVRFYGAVFGWEFTDNPMGRSITHRGVVIGGASAVKVGLDAHRLAAVRAGRGPRRGPAPHRRARGATGEPVLWWGSAGYALVRDPQGVAFAVCAG